MSANGAILVNLELLINEDRHRIRHSFLLIVTEYIVRASLL